jgi:methylmalonyl-CoA mutase N-terminal domain/subunit
MTDENGRARWQRAYDHAAKRDADFTTISGLEVEPVYGPPGGEPAERVGWPGEFPFTRGLYATGYRGKPWTIRQFSGFGNVRQTNERYKMLLQAGGAGLSVAFDMPTLMGRDSDDPRSLGEVGHCGVAIDSAADMDVLFDGIPLDQTTTSMTISGPGFQCSACTWSPPSARGSASRNSTERCRPTYSRSTSRRRSGCSRPSRTCA